MSRLNTFLTGIRVLDLSRHLPGPLATLLLADMGADVLKIEPPDGDELRRMGPGAESGESAYFKAVNAGKTSTTIDLKHPEQRKAFCALVRSADVLVESFRPSVMARLRLGYGDVRALNPRLVYCSLSGFGESGPLSAAAGHDINYVAQSGVLHHNGGGSAHGFDPPIADCTAALFAATTILGALHGRMASGRGCHIDLGIADAMMPLQIFHLAAFGMNGDPPQPSSGLLNGGAAYYRTYETSDGRRVSLGAIEPKFWAAFCCAAGRPDWAARQCEPFPQQPLIGEIAALFRALTLEECNARFGPADCCYAPVLDLKEAVESPRVQDRGLVLRGAGGIIQALFPALVDGQRPSPRTPLRQEDRPAGEPALAGRDAQARSPKT